MFTRMSARTLLSAALVIIPAAALAGPKVVEEVAKIPSPDPTYTWPISVAVDGDWLIAAGLKRLDATVDLDNSAWLYHRDSAGNWNLVRRLAQSLVIDEGDDPMMKVSMRGGVAAIIKHNSNWIFERVGNDWVSVPSPMSTDGMDVEVNDGTIVVSSGHCDWIASAYRKGTNGAWQLVRQTDGEGVACENEDERGDVDVSGSSIIVATYGDSLEGESVPNSARIFEGPFGTTPTMTRLTVQFGENVALDGASALVTGDVISGTYAFTRDASGVWSPSGTLQRPDSLATWMPGIKARDGFVFAGYGSDDAHGYGTGSIGVFQRNANGTYSYVAKLLASDGTRHDFMGGGKSSGRRVVAGSIAKSTVYVFELPTDLTQPATLQDDFEDGNASTWTPLAGSNFTVVTTPTSRVYRQSSLNGNSASLLNATDRTNQAVEADIKPTAYATGTGEKWFGLVTRYTDAGNYYYVTVRSTNVVQLKKIVNGVFSTLASATLPVSLNRNYRVRLEAVGTRLRVFVDNQLLADANDSALTHGQAGVMMYKTRADYDNILVSANPRTLLASYEFPGELDSTTNWEQLGTWLLNSPSGVFTQTTTTSGAHSIAGIPTGDQVVYSRMRRTSAAGTNNWFGLATRFRDAGNYYYVTLRNNNTISLRKLVNGAIVELDNAPFTVGTNTWYRVRFEAVADHLRVYIDDQLRLEAIDGTHATGRYGPIMYRTAAQFDEVVAVEP